MLNEIELVREINPQNVVNGNIYKVVDVRGKEGLARAEVKEEWVETHPRMVHFIALDEVLIPGYGITKIYEVSG